jgi:nickel/cobalt transporter (NicO) family protein
VSLRFRIIAASGLGLLVAMAGPAAPASAHPLGNFTVNTYSGIVVAPDEVRVTYVLDLAEIPTFEEMAYIDSDVDGVGTRDELAVWAMRKARELRRRITLAVDGQRMELRVASAVAAFSAGQGGLDVLRLEVTYSATPIPERGRIEYRDENFAELIGWREITARGVDGRAVIDAGVPAESVSDELHSYPNDLLSNPVEVTEATLSFAPGSSGPVETSSSGTGGDGRPGLGGGGFAGLVSRPELTLGIVALSLLLAIGFGALHALAPGHGKTITAAYLVGTGGRVRQALAVGAAVALMHTAAVLGLGIAILSVQRVFPAERVYPWLGLAAGLVALGLGTWLLIVRIQAWSAGGREADHAHVHEGDHEGEHPLEHPHPQQAPGSLLSRRGLAALAVSGGLLPSPTALIVLLGSVALNRLAFGLALIAAFSVGLAGALAAIGALAIRARDLVAGRTGGRLSRLLPVASAVVILVVGAALVLRAVIQL